MVTKGSRNKCFPSIKCGGKVRVGRVYALNQRSVHRFSEENRRRHHLRAPGRSAEFCNWTEHFSLFSRMYQSKTIQLLPPGPHGWWWFRGDSGRVCDGEGVSSGGASCAEPGGPSGRSSGCRLRTWTASLQCASCSVGSARLNGRNASRSCPTCSGTASRL